MIYFISGHRDLSHEDFEKYYIPSISRILLEDLDSKFVIGDCDGVDKYAMDYVYNLLQLQYSYTGVERAAPLIIFYMGDKPKNTPNGLALSELRAEFIGGFKSDEERDSAMTEYSDYDIAFVKDNRWDSGTAQNIKRRHGIV